MYTKVAMLGFLGAADAFGVAPAHGVALAGARMPALRMADEAAPAEAPAEAAEEEEAPPPPPPARLMSESLPFLTRRESLGPPGALVGDVGFDPLGFTEVLPLVRCQPRSPPQQRSSSSSRRRRVIFAALAVALAR